MIKRPVIGLALGGGGARGLAHIGILKAIRRAIRRKCWLGAWRLILRYRQAFMDRSPAVLGSSG